jgi:hypothetical protein
MVVSEKDVTVVRTFHLAIRVVLVLACAFWALILVEVVPAFFVTGINGVRGKLMHIWSMGKINLDGPWSCQDSLQLVHEGYTDLLVLVLATWGLLEVKHFLEKRGATWRLVPTEDRETYPFDNVSGRSR